MVNDMRRTIRIILAGIALCWMCIGRPALAAPVLQLTPFPTPTPGPDGRILYKVQPGDTLLRISLIAGVPLEELRGLNNLTGDNIVVGDELLLGLGGPSVVTPTPGPSPTPTPLPPTSTPAPPTATPTAISPSATPTATPIAESTFDGVRVTFVFNAGFLITAGDKRILIDAIGGYPDETILPPRTLAILTAADQVIEKPLRVVPLDADRTQALLNLPQASGCTKRTVLVLRHQKVDLGIERTDIF